MSTPDTVICVIVGVAAGIVVGWPFWGPLWLRTIAAVATAVVVTIVVQLAMLNSAASAPVFPGRGVHTIEPPDAAGGPR